MSYPTHLQDEQDRPAHSRLTSSAYLLGGNQGSRSNPNRPRSRSIDSDQSSVGEVVHGGMKSYADARKDPSKPKGDGEGVPMVGLEAVRLGTSFFCFGMLIGRFDLEKMIRNEAI
jgi:hypothetical protein